MLNYYRKRNNGHGKLSPSNRTNNGHDKPFKKINNIHNKINHSKRTNSGHDKLSHSLRTMGTS